MRRWTGDRFVGEQDGEAPLMDVTTCRESPPHSRDECPHVRAHAREPLIVEVPTTISRVAAMVGPENAEDLLP